MRVLLLTIILTAAPPGTGLAAALEGRLSLAGRPEAVGGLHIELLGVSQAGETARREARTDETGRFLFRELEVPALYLVRAEYDGVFFSGPRTTFHPGEEDETKSVEFEIHERSEDAAGLSLGDARWVVERGEAGSYRISQSAVIRNPRDQVVVLPEDAPPALRLPVLPGHGEIHTDLGPLPQGFSVGNGALELRGPIYPGDGRIEFGYEIDAGSRDLQADLLIPDAIEDLDLYVRDVGVLIDAGPLHPARAVRDGDEFYQHYVGFEVEAGTRIPLRIRSLPEPDPMAVWPRFLAIALIAGTCAFYVGWPVARGAAGAQEGPDDPEAVEKQRLFAALRDLEHDYETGKLSTEDHDRLRDELRSDALRALARMRAETAPQQAVLPSERRCSCGRPAGPEDRFCSGCGRRL